MIQKKVAKVAIPITQEQLDEMNDAYKQLIEKKISEDDYIQICAKYGCKPIDKRKEPIYDDRDNSSRIGFKWCCYNSERGRYFQNVLKIMIRTTLAQVHSLLVGKEKEEKSGEIGVSYKDPRLMFLDKLGKDFVRDRMGNHDGGMQYKKDLSNQSIDILLWYANNDIGFRSKLFMLMNTFADKKTLFELTEPEQYNDKKFG